MIARLDWLENYSIQGLQYRSSSDSAEPLAIYQMINELINEIFQPGNTLVLDANAKVSNIMTAGTDFLSFGFSQSC